ncbi:partner and localizer of BRCA2 isoform X2 [Corapipo altera]|uniref:partner and localizer of BRCA2 isoform X2 n=1 Tax=Corapipo altera TaxID=415028 RepID=UPI000FD62CEB|nr:partner and localizer of BRCA2 isoform X2 [Corapipo altera]
MEEPRAAAALSGADREKLREKLALLRREYSETVIRLRRARRAERARSHGRRERSPPGSKDNASPSADRGGLPQLQTKTCSDVDVEEATSVTFKHIPEFSSDEVSLQDSSRAESVQASQENLCCGIIRPVLEEKTSQTSRGMMKLRRRTKALESREGKSVHDGHVISTDETVKNQTASAEELQSPVFRHGTLSHTEEHPERSCRPALVKGEGNSFTPDAASGAVQEVFEGSVTAGEPELSPHVVRDSSDIWQLKCPRAVTTPGSREPCSQEGDSLLLDTRGDGEEECPSVIKQLDSESLREDQGELCGLLDLVSENEVLPEDRNNTVTKESKSHEGDESDGDTLNPCPADPALGSARELLEDQQLESQSRLFPPREATAPEGTLSSCTVVEGLLFPVEYYVRTTRRMSNCQRKVDLDAVILSQLGRSKKGQRSKCKQKDANSDQPSQERAKADLESGVMPFPFLGAEKDPANSSSSERSLPVSSSSSTSLGSISQKSVISTRQEQSRSQRKQKGRRRSACKAPVRPVSQELIESVDLIMARESSALLSGESQSEKENCDANLEKSSSDESKLSGAAALGSGETGVTEAAQPAGPDPPQGGSQVPGKCLLEQVQNPLQSSDAVSPGNETFARHVGDLEANSPVCQADKHPVASVKSRRGAGRAEPLPGVSVPLRRSLRCSARHSAQQGSADDSSRGHSCPRGSEGPAALGLPAADPDTRCSLFSFRSPQGLVPRLGIRDFHLPNEEFGVLKLEKLKSSPVNDLEDFVPSVSGDGVAPQDAPSAQMNPEEKRLRSNLISPSKTRLPELPCVESPASKKDLSTHELLFTPMETVSAGAPTQRESQSSSSVFPAVGATPGVLPAVHSEVFPATPSVPTSQGTLPSSRGAAQVLGDGAHKDPAMPLLPDSCGAGAATNEEEQGTMFALADERGPENKSDQAVALDKHQQSESKEQGSCRASPEQKNDGAEQLTPVLPDGPKEENLQLVSELKDSSGSCAVDVSTVWWEAAGCRELRVVTASESSVSLWEPLAPNHWGKVCTWQLGEIPVIQIVPLPDTCNLVCVALGELEIGEIRTLLYSSETDLFRHSLVKSGNIKAVVGLKDQRLVSSSRTLQEQQVEMVWLSGTGGSKDRQTLMPPEETVTAFAEVEGMREALVGTTAANSIVVWNLRTGQLLRKMHVGYSYPASICHRAYSDSGLLFVVLSHPHAKESESCGNPAFRVVAFNPRTGRSRGVMFSSPPPSPAGSCAGGTAQTVAWLQLGVNLYLNPKPREQTLPCVVSVWCLCRPLLCADPPPCPCRYLEGDVWGTAGAAVLTSGAVAVWDLLWGRCTAVLPPGPAGRWALARWAMAGAGLLAGQHDGTVRLYRYRQPQPGAA